MDNKVKTRELLRSRRIWIGIMKESTSYVHDVTDGDHDRFESLTSDVPFLAETLRRHLYMFSTNISVYNDPKSFFITVDEFVVAKYLYDEQKNIHSLYLNENLNKKDADIIYDFLALSSARIEASITKTRQPVPKIFCSKYQTQKPLSAPKK